MIIILDRWEGPFEQTTVRDFFATMRDGVVVHVFKTYTGPSGQQDADPQGWFQKEDTDSFTADTPTLGQRLWGNWIGLDEVVKALLDLDPEYALHNSEQVARRSLGHIREATQVIREEVREVSEDPQSGHVPWLTRRKIDYWRANTYSWGLASAALHALGYPNHTPEVCEELVPVVEDAFEVFKQRRPQLDPR